MATLACTPTFNWREIHADDEGYRVMMPAKPSVMVRRINLDGLQVDMAMQAVQVEGMSFAVGSIRLPVGSLGVPGGASGNEAALSELRERALAGMRAQMVRNIRGVETAVTDVPVKTVDRSGKVSGSVGGRQVLADGHIGRAAESSDKSGPPHTPGTEATPAAGSHLFARFVGRGDRVIQAVIVGPAIDREQAAIFIDSLQLVE